MEAITDAPMSAQIRPTSKSLKRDIAYQNAYYSTLTLTCAAAAIPKELGVCPIHPFKHCRRDRLRQARIVEPDAEIVAWIVAARALTPGGA